MKRREPILGGFVENAWYERVAEIMRTDPKRFFLFSPSTKYALSIYLDLKERYRAKKRAA